MGTVMAEQKRYREALSSFDDVLEVDPNNVPAFYNKGLCHQELKEYESAIVFYTKSFEIAPNFLFAKNNLRICSARFWAS